MREGVSSEIFLHTCIHTTLHCNWFPYPHLTSVLENENIATCSKPCEFQACMKVPYSQNFKLLCSVFWGLKITEHTNTSHCCVRYFRADHFLKNAFFRTSIFSENRYNLPYVRYFFFHFLNFSKKYRTYGTISFSGSEKKLPNLIKICRISGGLGQVDPNFLELPLYDCLIVVL